MAPILRLDNVSLAFGSRPLLEQASLQLEPGERACVVGRNGEGKSSLLRLVSGAQAPDAGEVWLRPGTRLAMLEQDIVNVADATVGEVVSAGATAHAQLESWEVSTRVAKVLSRLGLDGAARYEALSGGWRRRALLGRALAVEPELLLLDEPTNHLDIPAIEWLEAVLREYRGALLFVSHDRRFMDRVATRIVDLDRGRLTSWPGNYGAYAARKAAQLADEERANQLFDKHLAQEEVWIRKGVEARRTRNEGRVRALQALREERRARRDRPGQAQMAVQEALPSGELVFEAEDAAVAFGERSVFRGLNTRILRGERIGIVGPNGAGKSTLLKLLLGELEPSSGRVRRGGRLQVAYYDQQRAQLDLDASVAQNINARSDFVQINGQNRHVSGYLRDFLFRPDQLLTPARALSGGERNRLLLARLFAQPANLLVLDEPTNDLDIDTLDLLQELVADFAGTLLLVSHDRAFLDDVVTSLLVLEGDGSVQDFVGGYGDWASWRDARDAARAAASPAPQRAVPAAAPERPAAANAKRRKLSYREQRELAELPGRLEALEQRKALLTAETQDPAFYARPHDEVAASLATLAELDAEIDTTFARWAQLEDA
jgi:ATP-binding cassette subfamily F protein uup